MIRDGRRAASSGPPAEEGPDADAFAGLPAAAPTSRAVDGIETFYGADEGIGYVVAGGAPREQLAAIAAEVYESAEATRTGG